MGSEWQSERERGKPARCTVYERVKRGRWVGEGARGIDTQTTRAGRNSGREESNKQVNDCSKMEGWAGQMKEREMAIPAALKTDLNG